MTKTDNSQEAEVQDEAVFLKFTGPMRTLSRGKMKFEKGRIYKVLDLDVADDLLDTGRFQETHDPSKPPPERRRRSGGVRIRQQKEDQSERGDLSQKDLKEGGGSQVTEGTVEQVREPEDDRPKLPAQGFTSKKEAAKWAQENLGLKLDTSKAITTLNKQIVQAYGEKFSAQNSADDFDDDTREENTTVDAVVVA